MIYRLYSYDSGICNTTSETKPKLNQGYEFYSVFLTEGEQGYSTLEKPRVY